MHWTIDYYAAGKKGCYRLVNRKGSYHVMLLKPGEGFWDDVLHNVKVEKGRCPAAEAYDEAPTGWETVEGGAKKVGAG